MKPVTDRLLCLEALSTDAMRMVCDDANGARRTFNLQGSDTDSLVSLWPGCIMVEEKMSVSIIYV